MVLSLENLERLPIKLPPYVGGNSPPFSQGQNPEFYKELGDTAEGKTVRTDYFEENLLGLYLALGRPVPYAFRTRDGAVRSLDAGCVKFLLNRTPSEVELIRDAAGYIVAVRPLAVLLARYEQMRDKIISPYVALTISAPPPVEPSSANPVTTDDPQRILEDLRPRNIGHVMDLVHAAGIDVSGWSVTKTGRAVRTPKANPNYCYDWSFGGSDEPTALCIWYDDLKIIDDKIVYDDNLRNFAVQLEHKAGFADSPRDVVFRSRSQAKRARKFDAALQDLFRAQRPLRTILLGGKILNLGAVGRDSSKVTYRRLDPEPWTLQSYNPDDGSFRLMRGLLPAEAPSALDRPDLPRDFVDQFEILPVAERIAVAGFAYGRSAEVRRRVLERANGACECCGQPGFRMANGAVYLETHHVVPLSEGGADKEWNVVAVCSNDHKRAHFSEYRDEIKKNLLIFLQEWRSTSQVALQRT